jgi:hypothetical protein
MVRQPPRAPVKNDWEKMPLPILVVEVVSIASLFDASDQPKSL